MIKNNSGLDTPENHHGGTYASIPPTAAPLI